MARPSAGNPRPNPVPNGVRPEVSAPGGHPAISYRDVQTHAMPASREEARTAGGGVVRTRADGSRAEIHDVRRGMDIHYGLNGTRRVVTERSDHSRVFAERGGRSL